MVGRMPYTVQKRGSIVQVCQMVVEGEFLIGREGIKTQSRLPEKRLNHSNLSIDIIRVNFTELALEGFCVFQLLVTPME